VTLLTGLALAFGATLVDTRSRSTTDEGSAQRLPLCGVRASKFEGRVSVVMNILWQGRTPDAQDCLIAGPSIGERKLATNIWSACNGNDNNGSRGKRNNGLPIL
jgi:hypothetical protein